MAKYKRRIKLIKPRLQLRLTLIFVGLAALSLLMQFVLFMNTLGRVATSLPNDGAILWTELNSTLLVVTGTSFLVFMPLIFLVGVLTTFRIAGPVHRMEMYLRDLKQKGYSGPCSLRKGDKLTDLARLLSEAAKSMHERCAEERGTEEVDKNTRAA